MSRLGFVAVLLLAAVVSALTHLLGAAFFVIGVCGVSDTADRFPATASPQGLICDAGHGDSWWGAVGYGALMASALVAVVVAGLAWRRGGRWLAVLAPVAAPALTLALLAVPPDTCSDDARRSEPAYACETSPGG